jgi:hypothetical protein
MKPSTTPAAILIRTQLLLFLLLLSGQTVFPITVSEYREKLLTIRGLIDELLLLNRANMGKERMQSDEFALQRRIHALAVDSEIPVQTSYGSVTPDNKWLRDGLQIFDREEENRERREVALTGLRTRIDAILAESGRTSVPPKLSADEEKQRLSEILAGPEFKTTDGSGASVLSDLLRKVFDWIGSLFPDTPSLGDDRDRSGSDSVVMRLLLIFASAAAVGLLVWRFRATLLRRWLRGRPDENGARVVLGEVVEDGATAEDLFAQAQLLASGGDLRGAIRKGYIALICELGDRRIVRIAAHKTNHDYLREAARNSDVAETTRRLTCLFEEHWYGFAETEDHHWREFRESYTKLTAAK